MNILLTGASGFIGGHLRHILSRRHTVYALTRDARNDTDNSIIWVKWDLLSMQMTSDLLPDKIDAVIFLAQSRLYREFPGKAWDIFNLNVKSVLTCLEYARQSGAKAFLYASTANVYRQSHKPLTENSPLEPLSFYARSKRMAEILLEAYVDFFHCILLRLFTVYGPGQSGMLIPQLIEKIRTHKPIQVQGKGGFKLSPIYLDDVTAIFTKVLEAEHTPGLDILNVGGPEEMNILEIGTTIGEVLGISPRFEFFEGDEPAGWISDISKLQKRFNVKPLLPMGEGIRRMLKVAAMGQ